MNRIAWHIPLGIAASVAAHLWIFALVLDFPSPSQLPSRLTKSVNASLEVESVDRSPHSIAEENSETSGAEQSVINENHTIQFR